MRKKVKTSEDAAEEINQDDSYNFEDLNDGRFNESDDETLIGKRTIPDQMSSEFQVLDNFNEIFPDAKFYIKVFKSEFENLKVEKNSLEIIKARVEEISFTCEDSERKEKLEALVKDSKWQDFISILTKKVLFLFLLDLIQKGEELEEVIPPEYIIHDYNADYQEFLESTKLEIPHVEYFFEHEIFKTHSNCTKEIALQITKDIKIYCSAFKDTLSTYIHEGKVNRKIKKIDKKDFEKITSFLGAYILKLKKKPAIIPGWDDPYYLKEVNDLDWNADFPKILLAIKGRTRTRYGFERGDFTQGPHTIARVFGYNARRLYFRNETGLKKNVIKGVKQYTLKDKGINDVTVFKQYFSHLTSDIDLIMENLPEYNLSYSYVYEEVAVVSNELEKHNKDKYKIVKSKKDKSSDKSTFRKYPLCSYKDHLNETIKKFNASTTIKEALLYGQILSDLHPFATSFNTNPTSGALAGGGEPTTFHRLKWVSRLKINNTKMDVEILSNDSSQKTNEEIGLNDKIWRKLNTENSPILKQVIDSNEKKLELALELILPNSNQNKGLVDKGDFNSVPSNLQDAFISFIKASIKNNLLLLGFDKNLDYDILEKRVNKYYNYNITKTKSI